MQNVATHHPELRAVPPADPGTAVVTIHGELDIEALPANQARVDAAIDTEPRLLVLDLRDLSFLDSAGLTLLVRASRRMRNCDGTLVIANASRPVLAVITRMGLDATMRIEREPLDPEGARALR